jgi:hypothetical protein
MVENSNKKHGKFYKNATGLGFSAKSSKLDRSLLESLASANRSREKVGDDRIHG